MYRKRQRKPPSHPQTLEWYMANFNFPCKCGEKLKVHAFRRKDKMPQRVSVACWNKKCPNYGKEIFF